MVRDGRMGRICQERDGAGCLSYKDSDEASLQQARLPATHSERLKTSDCWKPDCDSNNKYIPNAHKICFRPINQQQQKSMASTTSGNGW